MEAYRERDAMGRERMRDQDPNEEDEIETERRTR